MRDTQPYAFDYVLRLEKEKNEIRGEEVSCDKEEQLHSMTCPIHGLIDKKCLNLLEFKHF